MSRARYPDNVNIADLKKEGSEERILIEYARNF